MINIKYDNSLHIKTLKLFNAVLARNPNEGTLWVSSDHGVVLDREAVWAKELVIDYLKQQELDGNALNKTFHKSWSVIQNSTRAELAIHQIFHYLTGYGTNFESEVYIPDEVLDVPVKLTFKVIKGMSAEELKKESLGLLQSGIALADETLKDVLYILTSLGHKFTQEDNIRNKEALVYIADHYDVYPKDPVEFLRYVVFKATGETLLIKNREMIEKIHHGNYDPQLAFESYGLRKLAAIFNRFKPLFLAFKSECPAVINKISKLSKIHHKPMTSNPLNTATSVLLEEKDKPWLDNATPYALFKALNACHARMVGQDAFVYRIRNGKSWTKAKEVDITLNRTNYLFLIDYMKGRFDFEGKKVYIPSKVQYALPTSEKMFVGNFPTGTKFFGEKLAAGVYWENNWGARDIDVSGMNIAGKIGWNSAYRQKADFMYSGDITNAPNGAVEYLWAQNDSDVPPTLLMSNIYSGNSDCDYKIVVGAGADVDRDYMMDPNKVMVEVRCQSVQKQTVLGMFTPQENGEICFTLLNFGAGSARVCGHTQVSETATKALYDQWKSNISLGDLLKYLGAEIHNEESEEVEFDIDLSVDKLDKTSIINLFAGS